MCSSLFASPIDLQSAHICNYNNNKTKIQILTSECTLTKQTSAKDIDDHTTTQAHDLVVESRSDQSRAEHTAIQQKGNTDAKRSQTMEKISYNKQKKDNSKKKNSLAKYCCCSLRQLCKNKESKNIKLLSEWVSDYGNDLVLFLLSELLCLNKFVCHTFCCCCCCLCWWCCYVSRTHHLNKFKNNLWRMTSLAQNTSLNSVVHCRCRLLCCCYCCLCSKHIQQQAMRYSLTKSNLSNIRVQTVEYYVSLYVCM